MKILDKLGGKLGLGGDGELPPEPEDEARDPRPTPTLNPRITPAPMPKARPMASTAPAADGLAAQAAGLSWADRSRVTPVQSKMKFMVIEPRQFDDVQQIANCLKERRPVLINFERTDKNDVQRILDFVSGTTYALAGDIKKVGHRVYLCAPSNVNVDLPPERQAPMPEQPQAPAGSTRA